MKRMTRQYPHHQIYLFFATREVVRKSSALTGATGKKKLDEMVAYFVLFEHFRSDFGHDCVHLE